MMQYLWFESTLNHLITMHKCYHLVCHFLIGYTFIDIFSRLELNGSRVQLIGCRLEPSSCNLSRVTLLKGIMQYLWFKLKWTSLSTKSKLGLGLGFGTGIGDWD